MLSRRRFLTQAAMLPAFFFLDNHRSHADGANEGNATLQETLDFIKDKITKYGRNEAAGQEYTVDTINASQLILIVNKMAADKVQFWGKDTVTINWKDLDQDDINYIRTIDAEPLITVDSWEVFGGTTNSKKVAYYGVEFSDFKMQTRIANAINHVIALTAAPRKKEPF